MSLSIEGFVELGYLGVFIVAFLLNLAPFTNPTNPLLVLLVIQVASTLNPIIVGILVALGATASKIVHYVIAYYTARKIKVKTFEDSILLNRFGFLASFLAAVTPLPDDWAAIPLAIVGFNIVKSTLGFLLGKLTTCITAGILGEKIIWLLEEHMGIWGSIISFVGTIILIIITLLWRGKIEKLVLVVFRKLKLIES
ncbi:MAG: VTT domain-containing protein [Candidatus Bathyarchaeota archaeon]|nr:VTT domain-containing protein [Candidatus Bathyarchaeota archaeon]